MPVSWPSAPFPQDFLCNVDGTVSKGVIETEMDAGPVKRRLKETGGWKRYKGSIIVTRDQLLIWETFFYTNCSRIGPFTWTDPFSRQSADFYFVGGAYSLKDVPNSPWRIQITFEIERNLQ